MTGQRRPGSVLSQRDAGHVAPQERIDSLWVDVFQQRGEFVVVRDVLPGAPADGVLREGMHLISVDGVYPVSVEDWAAALRGPAGTSVTIEVATRCGGHKYVTLERQLIRVLK